jgi:hypothetical protein
MFVGSSRKVSEQSMNSTESSNGKYAMLRYVNCVC